ncbi:MAG: carbohydrate binding family 9 domain-containing protein, partial [Candidatus Marinimicrobia bacterium]|nr:carbohydrate binding family 9 domain-containing protein [Candidatus Neomarinimicrobiota bacterium]
MKTPIPPTIDGVIDEDVWGLVQPATEFFRFQPEGGGPAPVKTEIKFLYDDVALYVAAIMYDPEPTGIPTQLGKRDNDGVVADWIGLWINPFNDGSNELNFAVTVAGAQIDRKFSPENVDGNWNPVWSSRVTIHELGWSVEMAIPFSQIRFPAKDVQTWGMNMARSRAAVQEVYTWTDLDKAGENFAQQAGVLHGIRNIQTPLRLSFTPYAAASLEHYPYDEAGKSNFSSIYRGGMDLKYGINESFTLDMTLIPDFGQVQSDNQELNLTPFEIRYDEHRPFFTEGTQLLQKAGLFYSRRVGSMPVRYWQVASEGLLEAGETILHNPDVVQLINATKVTGQTVNGIGLGFFNAITAETHAIISDSLGVEREYMTNPLSNYNLLVVGQNLRNGSDFSVVNSNVQRFSGADSTDDFRDANVLGFQTRLLTKDSKWVLNASGAHDWLMYSDSVSKGYKYNIEIAEALGILQYGLGHYVESEFYDPNDLGFLFNNNEFTDYGRISYNYYKPLGPFVGINNSLNFSRTSLFQPHRQSNISINYESWFQLKTFDFFGFWGWWSPLGNKDFFEPRVAGRVFERPEAGGIGGFLSTNYQRRAALDVNLSFGWQPDFERRFREIRISPRFRFSDNFQMIYTFSPNSTLNDKGFVNFDSLGNSLIGTRNRHDLE